MGRPQKAEKMNDKKSQARNGTANIGYTRDTGRFKEITKTIYTFNTKHGQNLQNMQGYTNERNNTFRQQSQTTSLYSLSWNGVST